MRNRLACVAALAVAVGLGSPVVAGPGTDFSGTWVLDNEKGRNLGMVAAVKETVVIAQTPGQLTLDFTSTFMADTSTRRVTYDLSGQPVANEGAMGEQAQTVARWDDGRLVVTWTSAGAVAGTRSVKTETRSLSPDGRTMTVVNARPNKEPMELVYARKE